MSGPDVRPAGGERRVVVTGAAGFVGANLVRRLLEAGHAVYAFARDERAAWRLDELKDDVAVLALDLRDADAVAKAMRRARADWIFHLGAYGAYSWQTDRERMLATNVGGTVNLLQAAADVGFDAFVNTGSSSEYGFKPHAPAETEPLEPNSDYAVTKASATLFASFFGRSTGERVVTMRLYSAYGPFEDPRRLVPTLITRGLRGELPPLVDPRIAHDFVYVDDVCDAYVRAAAARHVEPGSVYNVGSGSQTTIEEAVDVARRVLAIEDEPVWNSMPTRSWDTTVWVADNRKARRELGWEPLHSFEDGFRRTVEWLRATPAVGEVYGVPGALARSNAS